MNTTFRMHFPNSSFRENFADLFNDSLDEMQLMNFNMAADLIVYKLQLRKPIEMYRQFCDSVNLPYHNQYHTNCMVANIFEGLIYEDVPTEYWRPAILGGISHDAFHTGGKAQDDINIQRALNFLQAAVNMCRYDAVAISEWEHEVATRTVEITQYPYVREPVFHYEKIIRDADLMQPYEVDVDRLMNQYSGLKKEVEILKHQLYTSKEFADGTRAFLDGIVWHTSWAQQKATKLNWDEVKNRLIQVITNL
jgi:hypothetical protein